MPAGEKITGGLGSLSLVTIPGFSSQDKNEMGAKVSVVYSNGSEGKLGLFVSFILRETQVSVSQFARPLFASLLINLDCRKLSLCYRHVKTAVLLSRY